jgi:hypothetical protein
MQNASHFPADYMPLWVTDVFIHPAPAGFWMPWGIISLLRLSYLSANQTNVILGGALLSNAKINLFLSIFIIVTFFHKFEYD